MKSVLFLLVVLNLFVPEHVSAQPQSEESQPKRVSISAGMGVNYHNATDIVDRINGSGIVSQRVDDFKSAVEFFGAVSIPLSDDWTVKMEYAYVLSSYLVNSNVAPGGAEFSYVVHMPSAILQYVLFETATYNFKAGAGLGYHFGTYEEKFFGSKFSAQGVGSLVELEGNTALGDDLYAHLGVQARWEFVGDLKNDQGGSPLGNFGQTSMHFFSVGARLGMSYYF